MFITYQPEGSEAPLRREFQPGRIRESRAEMIERRYAKLVGEKFVPFEQWRMAVLQDGAAARRVLLWHLLSLDHPTVRIEDVDPYRDELTVQASKSELGELRETLAGAGGMDDAQRETMLAMIDAQIAAAPDDGMGKAPSPTSEVVTG
jgi:hypothetical protein